MLTASAARPGRPGGLIPEARRRQRRRRLLGAASVAIAAALVLVLVALASGGGPLGTVRDSLGPGAPPECRASQLTSGGILQGPGNGEGITAITNTSNAACSIPAPQVSLFARLGLPTRLKEVAVRQTQTPRMFQLGPSRPVVHALQPGQSAKINWELENWCHHRPAWVWSEAPIVRFRFGSALTVSGETEVPSCLTQGTPATILLAQPRAALAPPDR